MLAYSFSALTMPSPASAVACLLPRTPLLFWVLAACNAGRAAQQQGCAHRPVHTYTVQARVGTPRPPTPMSTSGTKTPQRANLEPESARRVWEGTPAGTRRLHAGAPFGKPRPPAGRAETALFNPHCLMLQQHTFHMNLAVSETAQLPAPSGQMALIR